MSQMVALVANVLQAPGLLLNAYCASNFRKRMRDINGRFFMPYFIAFVQSTIDCIIGLTHILCNISYFLHTPNTATAGIVCILMSGGLIDMALGMRSLVNLGVAVFNYIRLLYPFTSSPLQFKTLIIVSATSIVSTASIAAIEDFVELKHKATNESCAVQSSEDRTGHMLLMLGRLMTLFAFVYLYLLPALGTVYLYKQTIGSLSRDIADMDSSYDEEGSGTDSSDVLRLVLLELEKTMILDGLAMIVFFGNVFVISFIQRFCYAALDVEMRRGSVGPQLRRLFASTYCTFYIIVSLILRRVYRAPAEDLLKLLNYKPKNKAKKFSVE
ncbi:unnamed protein product [Mesocestoides corti]|uniref:G protein-coupled receptor n=1 Tax=Mesocestoides corti TaxID=53468 RepID=A0A0R3UDW9_MESCO|nr:unnamed protein product [Mesocestoides corti]